MTGDYPTFDYETAWDEIAAPAFQALPSNLSALYARTCDVARDLAQVRDLSMPWPKEDEHPEAEGFRNAFREIPAEELSHAARVVYYFGHWRWRHEPGEDRTGGHWKFAHYADQELRTRLKINPKDWPQEVDRSDAGNGVRVAVHEGWLRMQLSTPDGWTWHEVGPATARNLERTRHVAAMVLTPRDSQRRSRAAWNKTWSQFKNLCKLAEWLCCDDSRAQRFAHVAERYMVPNSELTRRHDERREAARRAIEAAKEAECARCCAL